MLKAQQITTYLKQHPDFFEQHPDLLTHVNCPNHNGTTSLLQKQIEVLREREYAYKKQIESFVKTAHDNEYLEQKMHLIALDLIAWYSTEKGQQSCSEYLLVCIRNRFEIELSIIFMEGDIHTVEDTLYSDLITRVGHQSSVCDDRLSSELLDKLFHSQSETIKSCAFVPVLYNQTIRGVLVLGACDRSRFSPKMGSVYLDRLGQLVGNLYVGAYR